MTVLSDGSIRAQMGDGTLVVGNPLQAVHCSYEFLPAKVFPGGHVEDDKFVIDWTDPSVRSRQGRHTVEPGAVVWVRAADTVRIPRDVCGLWLQTNTLSRQGLLLINSSLVEPGYEGHLSCNFVNFGREPVYLTPTTPIAKLLLIKLDKESLEPFEKKFPEYDQMIARTAASGPGTFLQIAEMSARLDKERANLQEDLAKQSQKTLIDIQERFEALSKEAGASLRKEREDEFKALKDDFHTYLKKLLPWVLAVGAILVGISWLSDWARGHFSERRADKSDLKELVDKSVQEEIAKHAVAPQMMVVPATIVPVAPQPPPPGTDKPSATKN